MFHRYEPIEVVKGFYAGFQGYVVRDSKGNKVDVKLIGVAGSRVVTLPIDHVKHMTLD